MSEEKKQSSTPDIPPPTDDDYIPIETKPYDTISSKDEEDKKELYERLCAVKLNRYLNEKTELANAKKLVDVFGDGIRYTTDRGVWLCWDDTVWGYSGIEIDRDAKEVGISIGLKEELAEERLLKAIGEKDSEQVKICKADLKAWSSFAKTSTGKHGLKSMIDLSRNEPGIPITIKDLDKNNWLLTCPNGTVDLRTGVILPNERKNLLTRLCPTEYDPSAICEYWKMVVLEIMNGDHEMVDFLQVAFGYALTGCVKEELLFMLWGDGSNGKSTLLHIIQDVLGEDNAIRMKIDVILERGQGQHSTDLAHLCGKRIALCSEPDASARLAEGVIKSITGGDKITARELYENPWEFQPTHTIFLACNNKPVIRGQDHGIWRRICAVPFEVSFTKDGRIPDTGIKDNLIAERSGILNWLIEGAQIYLRDGIQIPQKCQDFTDIYRDDQNILFEFISSCCTIEKDENGNDQEEPFGDLYKVYSLWCETIRERPISKRAFGSALDDRGFSTHRSTGGMRTRKGIKLVYGIERQLTPVYRSDEPYQDN